MKNFGSIQLLRATQANADDCRVRHEENFTTGIFNKKRVKRECKKYPATEMAATNSISQWDVFDCSHFEVKSGQ